MKTFKIILGLILSGVVALLATNWTYNFFFEETKLIKPYMSIIPVMVVLMIHSSKKNISLKKKFLIIFVICIIVELVDLFIIQNLGLV